MTDRKHSWQEFLAWEAASHDAIDFKTIYVDMAGDLVAGLLLSQLVYWHLPNKHGKGKLRITKGGQLWLAKRHQDWYEEVRITVGQAKRAIGILVTKGIIETDVFRFNGSPTVHLRILPDGFAKAWDDVLTSRQSISSVELIEKDEMSESLTENTSETTTEIPGPQKGLLAPSGAEDVQRAEPEPVTLTAGVLSDETTPEQTPARKGNGSRQDTNPSYAGVTPDVGSEKQQRDAIPYDRKAVFSALVEVCHVEPKAMRGPLNQTVKRLSLAEVPPTPAELRALYGREGPWYTGDWRGDKRPVPTLAQVVSDLVKLREAVRARLEAEKSRAQGAGEW